MSKPKKPNADGFLKDIQKIFGLFLEEDDYPDQDHILALQEVKDAMKKHLGV